MIQNIIILFIDYHSADFKMAKTCCQENKVNIIVCLLKDLKNNLKKLSVDAKS